jgi:hypothetical protein
LGRLGSTHDEVDGELLACERYGRRKRRFDTQERLRPSRQRERIHRNAQIASQPSRARNTALVLAAIGNEGYPGSHAARQTRDGVAHCRFQIGTSTDVPGTLFQRPALRDFRRIDFTRRSGKRDYAQPVPATLRFNVVDQLRRAFEVGLWNARRSVH